MSLSALGTQYARCMVTTSFSPRARQLGAALKAAREDRGVGVRELAGRMKLKSHSVISLWESGKRVPSPEDVASYATAIELAEDERQALVEMARHAKEPHLLAAGIPGVPEVLGTLMEIERTARLIIDVSPVKVIPGMLQTGDYARAVMGNAPGADTRVAMRLARADILTRRNPVELVALIGEEALQQPIADPDVMVEQLRHLRVMAKKSAVTVQVIPARTAWHPGMTGPFELVEFEQATPIVHLEHYRASAFVFDDDDVAAYQKLAQFLRKEVAMSPEESVELIAKVIKETTTP